MQARRSVQVRIYLFKIVRRESNDCASSEKRGQVGSRNGIQQSVYFVKHITKSRPLIMGD